MQTFQEDPPLTFLDRLRETFAQLADVIPAMLGALIILFAGYLLAKLIEQGTERLLHRIRLNQALERGGVMDAVERGAAHFNPTKVIGIAMNTYDLDAEAAWEACEAASRETGLPCTDPVRFDAAPLIDAIAAAHAAKTVLPR